MWHLPLTPHKHWLHARTTTPLINCDVKGFYANPSDVISVYP